MWQIYHIKEFMMGAPMEVNSMLKVSPQDVDFKTEALEEGESYLMLKTGYRLLPMDCKLQLVNPEWQWVADVTILSIYWNEQQTFIRYVVERILERPFALFPRA